MRIYLCCIYPKGVLFLNILPKSLCKNASLRFLIPSVLGVGRASVLFFSVTLFDILSIVTNAVVVRGVLLVKMFFLLW